MEIHTNGKTNGAAHDKVTIDVTSLPTMAEVERQYIQMVLAKSGGNKVQAAKTLGLSVKTIYNKLGSYKEPTDVQTVRVSP